MTTRALLALSLSRHTKTETVLQRRARKATRRIIIGGCP
jgi:hypothetical protein